MPKAKAKKAEKKRDARYEAFRAEWERAKPRRLQRQRGRGKPGDINYRPPVIGSPRPHKTSAADFLDELLWLAAYPEMIVSTKPMSRCTSPARSKTGSGPKTFAFRRLRDTRSTRFIAVFLALRGRHSLAGPSGWRLLGRWQHSTCPARPSMRRSRGCARHSVLRRRPECSPCEHWAPPRNQMNGVANCII
jgi:hypothetical protein